MYFCIFSFLFVFFRPLINISAGGFISLGILIPVLRYSQYLKHKIKYLIQGVSGVISFLILCSGFLYLYPEKPDIEGFINNRETQFTLYSPKNLSKQEAYIKIENTDNKKSQELIFTEGISVYPLKNSTNISYISRFQTGENYIIIQFPNNSLLEIYPQTQLSLQKENQKFSIELERGTIGRNTGTFLGNISILGEFNEISPNKISQFTEEFTTNLKYYLEEQIGSDLQLSPLMKNINLSVIKFLAKTRPASFSHNLTNYYAFEEYLFTKEIDQNSKYNIGKDIITEGNIFSNIKENSKVGKNNLKVLGIFF
ncbi:MAG: hypothetical protein PHU61_00300 [Candidatus Absconditabacteria bacterium]|nr:hypothetical protein [Candidatus Absconditabacteria bacterium]MDD3868631.1 hypothetical protein [Candidatus Absconditabacteria bacterium]